MPIHCLVAFIVENNIKQSNEMEDTFKMLLDYELRYDTTKNEPRSLYRIFEIIQHVEAIEWMVNILRLYEGTTKETEVDIQICSDLHIEFGHPTEYLVSPRAKYLALLGDIGVLSQSKKGQYREFVLDMANKFEIVFITLGNHEFYTGCVSEIYESMESICSERDNIVFLNKTSYKIEGTSVRVLGTCLWSFIPEDKYETIGFHLNDYRKIFTSNKDGEYELITPAMTTNWHLDELSWLQDEIKEAKLSQEKIIVMTHHSPILNYGCSDPQFWDKDNNSAFATNILSPYSEEPMVDAWAYGHTHWFHDMVIGGVRVVSNPHGYPSSPVEYNHADDPENAYLDDFVIRL
eukprot:TRINITY_DN1897_c0_g1_i4.p1 TRINITY_DN1897_c0_g1~~TRINITY_DN1897_c0_g1_i4.p1  ORF type:complete len:348 (+),score=72.42 TRINITY_DN1897_c0_g1_i4:840-1883(+)